MKLADVLQLNEMPAYASKKLTPNPDQLTHFYSDDTLAREWTFIKGLANDVQVYLANDHSAGIIGMHSTRPPKNETTGLEVYVTLEFKETHNLVKDNPAQLNGALQVDMVEAHNAGRTNRGFASLLYTTLVEAGITIISDNMQYFHGKTLWDSLIKESGVTYVVNILKNGQWVLDDAGRPLNYDGSNFPADQIWGPDLNKGTERVTGRDQENSPNYHTVLVLRKI